MNKTALFVSWCRPDLIRPRTVQIGRVAKGLAACGWNIPLICATFENEADLFDHELRDLYGRSFAWEEQLVDLNSYSLLARQRYEKGTTESAVPSWAAAVTAEVERWIRFRWRPLVVSFAQPWDSHMSILTVKRRSPRLRWVAHFSDPWADNPYLAEQSDDIRRTAFEREREVIEAADAVVFVTDLTAEMTMRKYPDEWRRKAVVIPHATDANLASSVTTPRERSPVFRITHTGALYSGQRSGQGLYEALRELRDEGVLQGDFELRMVGEMPPAVDALIRNLALGGMVSCATPLYFRPSLAEMNRADVLLVIDANFDPSPFLPSKIFDYLMFDRPIVALTPDGSVTQRFLSGLGYPTAVPDNIPAIKQLIRDLMGRWRAGTLASTAEHAAARTRYDLYSVGRQYSDLFNRI